MEAFKNTSMMIILAGIFYGAYQMFVSEPPNWKKNQSDSTEVLLATAADPGALAVASRAGESLPNQPWASPAAGDMTASGIRQSAQPNMGAPGLSAPGLPETGLPTPHLPLAGTTSTPPSIPHAGGVTTGGTAPTAAGWDGRSADAGLGAAAGSGDGRNQKYLERGGLPAPDSGDSGVQVVGHSQPADAQHHAALAGLAGSGSSPAGPGLLPISSGPSGVAGGGANASSTQQLKLAMEAAAVDIQAGDWTRALRDLSAWYRQPLAAEDREHLVGWLDRLAGEVVYSRNHTLVTGHVVAAGETLSSVAARYQMPPRLLARINQFPETVEEATPLQPGVDLKVVPGPFEAEAQLSSGQLTLYAGGIYAGRFMFVAGDSAPDQPIAEPISFVSLQGIPAQEEQRRHEPMAPTNPFGKYCLVIGQTAVLHSPGGNPQGSCLQFSEQDMQDLIILLPRGTTVRIIP